MATQLATSGARAAPPPFLLRPDGERSFDLDFADCLRSAVLADARTGAGRRERRRIAGLLCELGAQLAARRGEAARDRSLPLSRSEIASLLGVSLVRTKRALAMLCLAGAVRTDGNSIQVLDWARLCAEADYDRARLGIAPREDEDVQVSADPRPAPPVTRTGDPACFV